MAHHIAYQLYTLLNDVQSAHFLTMFGVFIYIVTLSTIGSLPHLGPRHQSTTSYHLGCPSCLGSPLGYQFQSIQSPGTLLGQVAVVWLLVWTVRVAGWLGFHGCRYSQLFGSGSSSHTRSSRSAVGKSSS